MWEELVLRELERERREALQSSSARAWMTGDSPPSKATFWDRIGFRPFRQFQGSRVSRAPSAPCR